MATSPPEIEGAEHKFVEAGGLRVHYAEAGDPSATPLLLLHGWPQHHGMWARVIELLGDRFRMIAPDLRGFGWTEAPGVDNEPPAYARDQVALLDALGIERTLVIGHDWGGWTAMLLGLDHSERAERMIVCNAPHPWTAQRPGLLTELWRTWYVVLNALPVLGPRLVPATARAILSGGNVGEPFTEAQIDAYAEQFRDPARARAATELYRYYFRVFAEGIRGAFRSKSLAVPTLLLFGARDRYVSRKLVERPEDYATRAPEMRVELVPDSGHFIVNEKPELVVERALAHFGAATRREDEPTRRSERSEVGPA